MDDVLQRPSVVVLGAGFSTASTDGEMPLMRTYFDRLRVDHYPLLHEYVAASSPSVATANVEQVLVCLEQLRRSPDRAICGWGEKFKHNADQIESELGSYTLSRLAGSLEVSEDNWAAELLYRCHSEATIISLNYDNIAERVLSVRPNLNHWCNESDLWPVCPPSCAHCKMRLILRRACSCDGHFELEDGIWNGACIKLHGSIAWKRCLSPDCCSFQCIVADVKCQPYKPHKCPNCRSDCAPVLVMPSMSKRLDETPEIHIMWKAAEHAIAEAESILLFGFSFPLSDQLFIQLIRSQVGTRRRLKQVGVIDLAPEQVIGRIKECVPSDLNVEYSCYKVVPGEVPEWSKVTATSG